MVRDDSGNGCWVEIGIILLEGYIDLMEVMAVMGLNQLGVHRRKLLQVEEDNWIRH